MYRGNRHRHRPTYPIFLPWKLGSDKSMVANLEGFLTKSSCSTRTSKRLNRHPRPAVHQNAPIIEFVRDFDHAAVKIS